MLFVAVTCSRRCEHANALKTLDAKMTSQMKDQYNGTLFQNVVCWKVTIWISVSLHR